VTVVRHSPVRRTTAEDIRRNVDVPVPRRHYGRAMARARWLRLVDLVVVLVLGLTSLAQLWFAPPPALLGGPTVHTILALAFSLPLLVRRQFAVAVFVTVLAAVWLQFQLGGGLGQPFFAALIALYAVGAHAARPLTYVGPLAVAVQLAVMDVPRLRDGAPWDEVVPAWFILAGTWAFGRWMRRRLRTAAALTERAEAAERDRDEQAARAVAEERARIARELHDLVAHSMSTIVVQAQGAQRVFDTTPEQARAALSAIETAGRAGLVEMRRLLGLLTTGAGDPETAPQPTLHEVRALVERMRAGGLPVDLRVEGAVRSLPAGLELTGYRVVQEAMTNALKHAGQVPVDVRLRYEPEWLDIQVLDRGPDGGPPPIPDRDSGSRGLVGMRERVSLYGGTLHTGPAVDGGFAVRARIPLTSVRA
jgi:signal transduction histidine kinase